MFALTLTLFILPASIRSVSANSTGLELDGSAGCTIASSADTCSATLTTNGTQDVVFVFTSTNKTMKSLSASGLSFTNLKNESYGVSGPFIYVYYAVVLHSVSESVTVTDQTNGQAAVVVWGVSGANTTDPFDGHSGLPAVATAHDSGPPSTNVETTNDYDIILGFNGYDATSCSPLSAGSGFTLIKQENMGDACATAEYEIVSSAQSGLAVDFSAGSGHYTWTLIADAVVAADPYTPITVDADGTNVCASASTCALTKTFLSNDLLVACLSESAVGTPTLSVSSSPTLTWTALDASDVGTSGHIDMRCFYAKTSVSPSDSYTVTGSSTSLTLSTLVLQLEGWENADIGSPLDGSGCTGAGSSSPTSCSVTTSNPEDMLVAAVSTQSSTTFTATSGLSFLFSTTGAPASNTEDEYVTSTQSSLSLSVTYTAGTNDYAEIGFAIKQTTTVLATISCTTPDSAPAATLTLQPGAAVSQSSIACDGIMTEVSVDTNYVVNGSVPYGSSTARYRMLGSHSGDIASHYWLIQCSSACSPSNDTYYQVSNDPKISPSTYSWWDGTAFTLKGTVFGTSGTVCTITTTSGSKGTDACGNGWTDYNQSLAWTSPVSGVASVSQWACNAANCTSYPTTGGNALDTVFYYQLQQSFKVELGSGTASWDGATYTVVGNLTGVPGSTITTIATISGHTSPVTVSAYADNDTWLNFVPTVSESNTTRWSVVQPAASVTYHTSGNTFTTSWVKQYQVTGNYTIDSVNSLTPSSAPSRVQWVWLTGYDGNVWLPENGSGRDTDISPHAELTQLQNFSGRFGKQNVYVLRGISIDKAGLPTSGETAVEERFESDIQGNASIGFCRIDTYDIYDNVSDPSLGYIVNFAVTKLGCNGIWFDLVSNWESSIGFYAFNQNMQNWTTYYPNVQFALNGAGFVDGYPLIPVPGDTWGQNVIYFPSIVTDTTRDLPSQARLNMMYEFYGANLVLHWDADPGNSSAPFSKFAALSDLGEEYALQNVTQAGENLGFGTIVSLVGPQTYSGAPYSGSVYDSFNYGGTGNEFARNTTFPFESDTVQQLWYNSSTVVTLVFNCVFNYTNGGLGITTYQVTAYQLNGAGGWHTVCGEGDTFTPLSSFTITGPETIEIRTDLYSG